jgi:hypothetical protein
MTAMMTIAHATTTTEGADYATTTTTTVTAAGPQTDGSKPVKQRLRRFNDEKCKVIDEEIKKLCSSGFI